MAPETPEPSSSRLRLTENEKQGQSVDGSRFGECTNVSSIVDEAETTMEYASSIADAVAVINVLEFGGAFYRDPSLHLHPRPASGWDAYRPIAVEVVHSAFGLDDGEVTKLRLPGGQIGCDGYSVDLTQIVDKPTTYAVFVSNDRDLEGNPVALPTIVRAWPMTTDGRVETPYDGEISVAAFISEAQAAR